MKVCENDFRPSNVSIMWNHLCESISCTPFIRQIHRIAIRADFREAKNASGSKNVWADMIVADWNSRHSQ